MGESAEAEDSEGESAEEEESTDSEGESADGSHRTVREDAPMTVCA